MVRSRPCGALDECVTRLARAMQRSLRSVPTRRKSFAFSEAREPRRFAAVHGDEIANEVRGCGKFQNKWRIRSSPLVVPFAEVI